MELHAFDRQLTMAEPHHQAVGGPRGDLEDFGHGGGGDDERVVAGRDKIGFEAREDAAAVVARSSRSCRA